jgi:tetratricopeptide (TPR) repeat protein
LGRDLVAADIALARYRFDEAEKALAGAFDSPGQSALADEAALGHARLQYLRGNFHQAVAEINRLLERAKGDDLQAVALVTLARALLEQKRPMPVDADQAVSAALVLARYGGAVAIATACSALVQAHFGNTAEALEAAARAPGLTVSKRYSAEAHCLAGDALRSLGRFGEARTHYQIALGLDSGSLEALWGLGTCAQMSGLYEVAESYFQLCLEAAPEHFLGRRSEDAIET